MDQAWLSGSALLRCVGGGLSPGVLSPLRVALLTPGNFTVGRPPTAHHQTSGCRGYLWGTSPFHRTHYLHFPSVFYPRIRLHSGGALQGHPLPSYIQVTRFLLYA